MVANGVAGRETDHLLKQRSKDARTTISAEGKKADERLDKHGSYVNSLQNL